MNLLTSTLRWVIVTAITATLVCSGFAAQAQEGTPAPTPMGTVPEEPGVPDAPHIAGAANPIDAPTVSDGTFLDSVIESETMWYAVDAAPGQRVSATVQLVGRLEENPAPNAVIVVEVNDAQRQLLLAREAAFTGVDDAIVELPPVEIPFVEGELPLLSVSLRDIDRTGRLGIEPYRLVVTLGVDGEPGEFEETTLAPAAPVEPAPQATITAAPVLDPDPPNYVADITPVALITLAIGGVIGFEFSRRGL